MTIRAVLFDLDGTLIDSLEDITHAANFAMRGLGMPEHGVEGYRPMVGDGADVLIQRALPADAQGLAAEGLRLFKSYYADHSLDHTVLYEGVGELLDALVERGVKIAVLSNKPDEATRVIVKELMGGYPWAAVAGHKKELPKKPDPTSALLMAEEMGVAAAECLFVGDSSVDIKTAVGAGMRGVGVAWGWRSREELEAAGVWKMIETADGLLELL